MTRCREIVLSVAIVVAAGLAVWGWVWWCGTRDEQGITESLATSPSVDQPVGGETRTPSPPTTIDWSADTGWPADWPTQRDIRLIAWAKHLDHLAELEAEAERIEAEASSMAIERQPSGEIVVTNPPEAPVEAVPEGELESLICSYDWDCGTALRVAACESTMNPAAVGRAGERGLFQIHPVHAPALGERWDQLFDPATNVVVAYEMWRSQGWGPWACYREGAR